MSEAPKWYTPLAVVALLWNLLGCLAFLADLMTSPEDVAALTEAQQTLYASRTTWMVAASGLAVWGGATGSLALLLKQKWAVSMLVASLLGLLAQDYGMFVVVDGLSLAGPVAVALQSVVLVVAIALVVLARHAVSSGWMDRSHAG